jgi:LacI family transcriptional regulator
MAVTMRDVAAKAGVTPTVVSRVLHNKATSVRVSQATAERILKIAKEMNYRVNVTARNFRDQQTLMIGILHGVGFDRQRLSEGSRYFACLVDGIVDRAFHYGYSVTFCPALMGDNPGQAVSDGRFDGLIWYSTDLTGRNTDLIQNCLSPLVVIHADGNSFEGKVSSVICDNHGGLSQAVDHLVELGHRNIGFVLENRETFSEAIDRARIFGQVLREKGLSCSDESILYAEMDLSGMREKLQNTQCTAVITSSEKLAGEVLRVAEEAGIRVPDDLSVVGFDSTEFCDGLTPKLTAIRQPLTRMGSAAVDLLMAQINDFPIDKKHLVIPCGLDIRESTTLYKTTKK